MIQTNLYGSILIILILVIRKLLGHELPRQYFVYIWYLAAIRFCVPNKFFIQVSQLSTDMGSYIPNDIDQSLHVFNYAMTKYRVNDFITLIWLAGIVIVAMKIYIKHSKYKLIYKTAIPIKNNFIVKQINLFPLSRKVIVKESDCIDTAVTYGVIKPIIILPKFDFSRLQLQYVLTHEMVHIQKHDIILKHLLILIHIIFWYNPLVHIMINKATEDIEISTDEKVVKMMGIEHRKGYAMTLIKILETKSRFTLCNNNFSNKNILEERIVNIMKIKTLRKKTCALAAVALLLVGSLALTNFSYSASAEEISEELPGEIISNEEVIESKKSAESNLIEEPELIIDGSVSVEE